MREARPSFPVVGIGASAGGLEAFKNLLHALPADTGMAFVLVQHLSPTHDSKLSEILGRATPMPVMEVRDEPQVRPNHVYVIPPGRNMIIEGSSLKLLPRGQEQGQLRSIDFFLRSLAEDQDHRAIGVILSGTASDGTLGLQEIKGKGGITFAQDETAQHNDMPRSAIAAGCVDFVLPPHRIAAEIARIAAHPYVAPAATPVTEIASETGPAAGEGDRAQARSKSDDLRGRADLRGILQILNRATDVDFSDYKSATLYRRITRRMLLRKMKEIKDYERFLKDNADEVQALYQDVLINVTSFFRDPKMFEALNEKAFPALFKDRSRQDPLRIWVLGCSTGEEAYSLAMAATEFSESIGAKAPLQVFATDLNAAGIDKARGGSYAKSVTQDVSSQRLRRFFSEVDGGYRVIKALRDICVFARHNVLAEPPFSRIDLISCRNLLIYLEPALQQRVVPLFHYALRPAGFLVLGSSETIGGYRDLFHMEDMKEKIFSRKPGPGRGHAAFVARPHGQEDAQGKPARHAGTLADTGQVRLREAFGGPDVSREVDRTLLARFAPPGVLVNPDLEILQFRGDTAPYLAPAPGNASLSLLKMAREGLLVPLRALLNRARKEQVAVREENVRIRLDGGPRAINLEAVPVKGRPGQKGPEAFLVLFEEAKKSPSKAGSKRAAAAPKNASPAREQIAELNHELAATREYLQSMIEQQEAANEELQSANEEAQSGNEELQSVNEELETSKEEIQSSNEELQTVNDELSHRNEQAARLNDDLSNLIASVQTAIVIVGRDLRIRRFSPMAEKMLKLIPADVGRPIGDLKIDLSAADVEAILTEVIDTVSPQEREVQDRSGHWYSLRMRPYLTLENKIDGAVLMLVDVDAMKRREEAAAHLAAIVTSSDDAIISKGLDGVIRSWNEGAQRLFGYAAEEIIGKPVALLLPADHADEEPGILERIGRGETIDHYETVRQRKDGSLLDIELTVSPIRDAAGRVIGAAKIARDITERKRAEVLVDSQRQALQLLASGAPLDDVLGFLTGAVERRSPEGMLASIVPLNEAGTHFQRGFGASLPDAFNAAVEGVEVSSPNGLCANAVQRREAVAVHDFNKDPAWQPFAEFVAPYGLRSGWSVPIISSSGQVLGTFANYYRHAGDPTPPDRELADVVVRTAAVAIERKRAEEALRQSYAELRSHTEEVSRFNRAAVGRESRMIELKQEVNELRSRQGEAARYSLEFALEPEQEIEPARPESPAAPAGLQQAQESRRAALNLMEDAVQSRDNLSETDRRKNEFLGMLAHELRNPLAPLSTALDVIKQAGSDLKAIPSLLPMMERQIHAMSRLVDDLLDVSRITHGKVRLRREAVELPVILNRSVEMIRHQTDARRQTLELSLPEAPIPLSADPTRLEQVFHNLLSNASKFGSLGGHIWLTAELSEAAAPASAREVVVRVRDDGSGIAPDLLPRVFDLFSQGESSLDRSQGGLGIGLALVRSLVELHGGRVQADSPGLGQGSEFRVVLPVGEAPATGATAATAAGREGGAGESKRGEENQAAPVQRRVLVVDDNRDAAQMLAMLLRQAGHEVQTAYDGREAVETAKAFTPEVVLLDIGLPGIDGYETARQLRQQPKLAGTRLIAVSGYGREQDRALAREAGFDHFLVKPAEAESLKRLLASP